MHLSAQCQYWSGLQQVGAATLQGKPLVDRVNGSGDVCELESVG